MKRALFFGMLGTVLGTLLLGGTYALATNTNFILGSTTANKPDALTAVTAQDKDGKGGLSGPMIRLVNPSTGSSATALGLTVGSGRPPFTTNSSVRVANLNADLLDGIDSSSFVKGGGEVLSNKLQVVPGDTAVLLLDHSATKPAFKALVGCKDDPAAGGNIDFSTTGPADMFLYSPTGSISNAGGTGMGSGMPNSSTIKIGSGWTDGHMLTMWVFLLTKTGQPDPRDDGCYFQMRVVVK
jgi:hypothetical protein